MTVIVGILCSDGVVIGSDSALAVGRVGRYTIERQEGSVFKIEIIEDNIITAFTGAAGLAQRFNDLVATTIRELRRPYVQPRLPSGIGPVGSPVQLILFRNNFQGKVPYDEIAPVEIGRIISQLAINDFQKTPSTLQQQPTIGWGFGALFAFVSGAEPQLIDFDSVQFHPELKGLPDPKRAGQDRIWRCVSMGAGQAMADAFLAHSYRLLFDQEAPTIKTAKLVVAWTIKHVIRYNAGLVGGELQLAILEKRDDGTWIAHHEDPGETEQQVDSIEKYISDFGKPRPEAKTVDLDKVLSGEEPVPLASPDGAPPG
jgi:20S proteasome alpha/beta subunit